MSTVTQNIPHFLSGISQQHDKKKFPHQLKDAINTYPDYALGMLKRPGGKFLDNLHSGTATGKWFSILRDANEKYVGQYDNNIFRIWSLLDGSVRKVDMGTNTGVPGGCNYNNLQLYANNYNVAVADTAAKKETLDTLQSTYIEVSEGQTATTVALFETEFNYNLGKGTTEETLKSGILQQETGNVYTTKKDGVIIGTPGAALPANYALGNERTNEHPILASGGYKIFEAIETVAAAYSASDLTSANTAMGTAQTNYNTAVTTEASHKSTYETTLASCAITTAPTDAYLKDALPADIEFLTLNDYTFVLNRKKTIAWTSDTAAALPHVCFIVINIASYNSKYEVKLGNDTFQYTTAEDAAAGDADATTIVSNLATLINADADWTAYAVGPGIHVTHAGAFSVNVIGGSQENAMYAFQDKITNVAQLPLQCKNGYKVKVVNSANIAEDDMWVEFQTSGSQTNGPGTWAESIEPGLKYKLDPLTMPHQLVRQADGSFTYGPVAWEERDVGDDLTNPAPTFVGGEIRNMFFFRNRFGFLSGDTVIMSKANSFFDFFVGSAQIAAADDPIDISASSTRPVFLNYVKTTSAGLVMFSDTEQFLLSTDSDILSPETAKINTLSAFEADTDIEPVNLGTSLAFVSKTPLWSRLFEISGISLTDPPQMFNTSSIVPELIPSTVDNITGSSGMSIVSLGQVGTSTLYQFRFYQVPEGRKASTWYKWDLTGNLVDQFFDGTTFYAVIDNSGAISTISIDLRQASDTGFLTLPTGERTDVCMDMYNTNPYRTYDAATNKTRVFLPFKHMSGKTFTVIALGGYIGKANPGGVGAILYPTVAGSSPNEYVDIPGDYRGKNLIIGYIYTMTVELPKLYYTQQKGDIPAADYSADLIIHRLKVSTGISGPVKYNVNLTGIPNRTHTVSIVQPSVYALNNVAMAAEAVHDVPVYQRNENISLSIVGDTPLPVSLLGMNWEGKYNKKFYNRV